MNTVAEPKLWHSEKPGLGLQGDSAVSETLDGEDVATLEADLAIASKELEHSSALDVLTYAGKTFGDGLVLTSSFQDCVLVDLAIQALGEVRIVFLDTGFHFPETLAYLHRIERRYGIAVEIVSAGLPDDVSPCGSDGCCAKRKVAPLAKVLDDATAWVTGVKRVDTPERADAPIIAFDRSKWIAKVNPIATWTEDDVEAYVTDRDLPRHPLNAVGYFSIGCAPTTRPVEVGDDPRSGRWPGSGKTECGLHI